MSTKSMKRNMSNNQRINRLTLLKYSTSYNKIEKENNLLDNQKKVEEYTQNTLRQRISTSWYEKNKQEREILNTIKSHMKINNSIRSKELKNEFLSVITKSNPRFNIVLKVI